MGAKLGSAKGGPMADINVTPLVDVVLVLLIIFMVVTPMLSSGIDVKLPLARSSTTTQDVGQHLVIGVRDDGSVFIDTEPVTLDTLIEGINEDFKENGQRSILIKAAENTPYRDVRAVTDLIADGGMNTMLLATEKPTDSQD